MWWNDQHLNQPRRDATGRIWHFRVWHDHLDGVPVQRIFFWDDERREIGLLELVGGRARVSEVLNRKRPLTLEMIRRLHANLGIPAEVLIQPYTTTKAAA